MLCDKCGKNPASMHMVTVVNGVKNEQHLCAQCAQQQNQNFVVPFSMGDVFRPRGEEKRCSVCGMTSSYLHQSGKLGCAQCYEDLKDELLPVLRRVHGRVQHMGRAPEIGPVDEAALAKKKQLEELNERLQKAVAGEEYEAAAQLRDEIKKLKEDA